MPPQPGGEARNIRFRQGEIERTHTCLFLGGGRGRKGGLRGAPHSPWLFVWEGTGEHYFGNGTTPYWLMGWDEETTRGNIDRLHRLGVNRLRVVINGRVENGRAWFEEVYPTETF